MTGDLKHDAKLMRRITRLRAWRLHPGLCVIKKSKASDVTSTKVFTRQHHDGVSLPIYTVWDLRYTTSEDFCSARFFEKFDITLPIDQLRDALE